MTDMFYGLGSLDLGSDNDLLGGLLKVHRDRQRMNLRRSRCFDGEKGLRDFGISIPPEMRNIGVALGWIERGVRAVTDRSDWEGFVLLDGNTEDPLELGQLLDENQFHIEFAGARVSSAVHGCSFTTVTDGDPLSGEPDVLIVPRAAEDSAAIYDRRRRSLKGFVSILETKDGRPTELLFYTPERIYDLSRKGGRWQMDVAEHPLGEVPVVAHPYNPELRRQLGHSRITRAAMYFVDGAMRTLARSEVSAELYSSVQVYLFGEGVTEMFEGSRWKAQTGMVHALDTESGENAPKLHRFSGQSPQPHTDHLRMFANLFADDQQLEVKFADTSNPASADAIFAAKEELITVTRRANRGWGYTAAKIGQFTVRLRDGHGAHTPDELRKLRSNFTDPAIVSPSARAAAFVQIAQNAAGFGESEVGLQYAGLTAEQIARFRAEKQQQLGGSILDRTLAAAEAVK